MSAAPIPLAIARRYAERISEWLAPECESLAVAGSIRRGRPMVNDVDLVVIPKLEEVRDLTGAVIECRNLTAEFLHRYCDSGKATVLAGKRESPDIMILQLGRCQLDIFFAARASWGTRLLCRTGSKEHNIHLCMEAQKRGLHWNPFKGVRSGLGFLPAETEEEVFAQIGVPYVAPERRER